MNFLFICFFRPFISFFPQNLLLIFLKHNYPKINELQPLEMKILIFYELRNEICTQNHGFGLDEFFSKGRGIKTACMNLINLVSKVLRYLKEKGNKLVALRDVV